VATGNYTTCNTSNYSGVCNTSLESPKFKLEVKVDGNLVLFTKADNKTLWQSKTGGLGVAPYKLVLQPNGRLELSDSKNTVLWGSSGYGKGTAPYKLLVLDTGIFSVSDKDDNNIWSSGTVSKAEISAASIIAKVPLAVPVTNAVKPKISSLDQFVKFDKMDTHGSDTKCFMEGQDAEFCAEKCLADSTCKSSSYVNKHPSWGGKSGCCYKTNYGPMAADQYVTLYVRKSVIDSNALCTSGATDVSCKSTLENSKYKLVMQTDGNLVTYSKPDNKGKWASRSNGKGIGPYTAVLSPNGILSIVDKNKLVIWKTTSIVPGTGPYRLVLTDYGSVYIVDSKYVVVWKSD